MSEEKTTVSIGFKTDVQGLSHASTRINTLQQQIDRLSRSLRGMGGGGLPSHSHHYGSGGAFGGGPFGGVGKGMLRGGMAGMAAFGLTMGGIALLTKSISSAKEYLTILDPLTKQLNYVRDGQNSFADSLARTGELIGKNRTEITRLAQTYVSMAGGQGGRVVRQVGVFGLFSKGMGLDAGMMAGTMGGFAQMGSTGQYGEMRMERLAAVLADAVSRGGMKGREAELFGSIQSLMGAQLNVLSRLSPGSSSAMIGALTAMNASGRPGLMGMRGANVLSRMNSAFMNPQGEFGEYFMYNALGGGDYFDYQMRKEQGIFGQGNLQSVMGSLKKSLPNDKARWYTLSKMFGISMSQAQAMEGLNLTDNSGFLGALDRVTGGSIEGISADKMGLMAEIYNAGGSKREALFKDSRIADLASKEGWNAKTSIDQIFQDMAGSDMKGTTMENTLSALASIENQLIEVGTKLIPPATKIAESLEKIIETFTNEGNYMDEDRQKKVVGDLRENMWETKLSKAITDNAGKIGSGLWDSTGPIAKGIGSLFTELGKVLKLEVKVTDERTAGDGSAAKVQR